MANDPQTDREASPERMPLIEDRFAPDEEIRDEYKNAEAFSRFGLFASVADAPLPNREDGAATAWGAVRRVLALLALAAPFAVIQAVWRAGEDSADRLTIGWLAMLGNRSGVLNFIVLMVGALSVVIMMFSTIFFRFRLKSWLAFAVAFLGLESVLGVLIGDPIGESIWWWNCYESGLCRTFRSDLGILGMLPGVIASLVAVAMVPILWATVGRAGRLRNGSQTKVSRWMYALMPGVCLLVPLVSGVLPSVGKTIMAFIVMAFLLGIVVPNELAAVSYMIRTRRHVHWMWTFAVALIVECGVCVLMTVVIIYGL